MQQQQRRAGAARTPAISTPPTFRRKGSKLGYSSALASLSISGLLHGGAPRRDAGLLLAMIGAFAATEAKAWPARQNCN